MASSVTHAGWSGADDLLQPMGESSVDAKRRTASRQLNRNASMPTPPRTRLQTGLPTPSSTHRAKPRPAPSSAAPTTSLYPTPPTATAHARLRRSPRLARDAAAAAQHASVRLTPPSPSGHTTFYLAHAQPQAPRSKDELGVRRRAGLAFNQQMGLAGAPAQSGPSSIARQGAGVGMGGRGRGTAHGRVDRITWTSLQQSTTTTTQDIENPFVAPASQLQLQDAAPIASPGTFTLHRPRHGFEQDDTDADDTHTNDDNPSSPLRKDRFRSYPRKQPPAPASGPTSALLSPPPTQPTQRILSFAPTAPSATRVAAAHKRRAAKERMAAALDTEHNVFLAQPGEVRRPGPVVDERGPYVDYVFRGAKKTFANPFVALSGHFPESELDPSHPDFEAHPLPQPKLLWPVGPAPGPTPGMGAGTASDEDADAEGVSPPSSPPAVTPRSRSHPRRGFGGRVRSSGEDELQGPTGLFEPHDEVLGHVPAGEGEDGMDEDEPDLEVRRGLLFGPGGMGGRKRANVEADQRNETTSTPRRSKKAKALRL